MIDRGGSGPNSERWIASVRVLHAFSNWKVAAMARFSSGSTLCVGRKGSDAKTLSRLEYQAPHAFYLLTREMS